VVKLVQSLASPMLRRTMNEATGPIRALGPVRRYDRIAPKYDRQARFYDFVLFGGGREWVCSQAEGDVLEIAVGTGLNLPHYPEAARITGIDVSASMLELARRRAAALRREVDLRIGDAQALDFPDESFQTVTCTIALCTIPDDRAAVFEAMRVLRPGGRFVLLEHVRSPVLPIRLGQRALEPLFVRLEEDHLLREPLEHVRSAGFEVERLERSKLGIVERLAARKPLRDAR
jgi:ubiquinone/menaquinone biosynthesis C-methylase UbiE